MSDMNYVSCPGYRHLLSSEKIMKDWEEGCVIWQNKTVPCAEVQMHWCPSKQQAVLCCNMQSCGIIFVWSVTMLLHTNGSCWAGSYTAICFFSQCEKILAQLLFGERREITLTEFSFIKSQSRKPKWLLLELAAYTLMNCYVVLI